MCDLFSICPTSLIPTVNDLATAATVVWNYLSGLLLNMLILVGTVKTVEHL